MSSHPSGRGDPSKPTSQQHKPLDGPATTFEADPFVADIPTCDDGDYFGLVLVTNWPPTSNIEGSYRDFREAVASCFDPEDTSGESPAVYFQPTEHLHITLSTFVRIAKIDDASTDDEWSSDERRRDSQNRAIALVQAASALPDWPTDPIRLVVDSAQIGNRAGIVLWKDLSGGIDVIRRCLAQSSTVESQDYPVIPGIIHSTVLRFASVPKTPGEQVQEAFQSRILGNIGTDLFPSETIFVTTRVQLALETSPYMHIPDDSDHVLWSCQLTNNNE